MTYSKIMTGRVKDKVDFIVPLEIVTWENETEALAKGALRFLRGHEFAQMFN